MEQKDNQAIENGFVPAVCTQCGARLVVDPRQEAAVCEYCGTPYIVKKAINNYNVQIQNIQNTNNVQVGKKGVAQSAFEFLDKQQEREHERVMDARRRQEEAEKQKRLEEEEKKRRRKKGWATFGKVLLWIYLFPIMLTIFIWKNEKIQPKIKYALIGGLWVIVLLTLLFRGNGNSDNSGTSSSAVENVSTNVSNESVVESGSVGQNSESGNADSKEVETSETVEKENVTIEKEKTNDYEKGQTEYTFGDYVVRIPSSWSQKDSRFYLESGEGNQIAVLYPSLLEGDGYGIDEHTISSDGKNAFLESAMSGCTNPVLLSTKVLDVNGVHVLHAIIEGSISGKTGTVFLYWFINPSDGRVGSLMLFQGNDTKYDYYGDLEKIVSSITLNVQNNESTKAEASTGTNEKSSKKSTAKEESDVPREYISALKSAESYSELMHMSKKGIYDQLISEYGDQFSTEAAQYAVDNIEADWNENALKSAESYSEMMNMSKKGIYDQLISEYGDQFEPSEAQYAVDNIKADWNLNALESAKSYQEMMNMSPAAIYDQLISEYGDQFEESEAQYAIDHLND